MQPGIHKPLDLHAHAVHSSVGMGHVFLDPQAFVHDSHAGAGIQVRQSMRHLADFLAQRLVEGKKVCCSI